jgi:hypothetical protein
MGIWIDTMVNRLILLIFGLAGTSFDGVRANGIPESNK